MKRTLAGIIVVIHILLIFPAVKSEANDVAAAYQACVRYITASEQMDGRVFAMESNEYVVSSLWKSTQEKPGDVDYFMFEFAEIYPGLELFTHSAYLLVQSHGETWEVIDDQRALAERYFFPVNKTALTRGADFVWASDRKWTGAGGPKVELIENTAAYLDEMYGDGKFLVDGVPHKRTAYVIECQNNAVPADYQAFQYVVVIDYTRQVAGRNPFLVSCEEAAGVAADGTIQTCRTPEMIRKRAFRDDLFTDVLIDVMVYREGVLRSSDLEK